MRVVLGVAVLCLSSTVASARSDAQRARDHFELGLGLFRLGNYPDALKEFTTGYAIAPRAAFLVDIAQCHRKLGDLEKAKSTLEKFLVDAPKRDPLRPQVSELLAQVEGEIAHARPSPPPAPPPVAPQQQVAALHTLDAAPQQANPPPIAPRVDLTAPAPTEKAPTAPHSRRWVWGLAAGIVAVVAAAVAVGLVFGLRSSGDPCAGADVACLDLRH